MEGHYSPRMGKEGFSGHEKEKVAEEEPLTTTSYRSDDERVSSEFGFLATEKAIRLFREILSGLSDYAVMSSTALYLHDKKAGQRPARPPGDFDAVVFSEKTLQTIIDRLSLAGAIFRERDRDTVIKKGSPIRVMPDHEAKVVTGYFPMDLAGEGGKYKFEFFYNTQVAPQDIIRHRTEKLAGLNVLTKEGLQFQYQQNLRMEQRIGQAEDEVVDFLLTQRDDLESYEWYRWAVLEELSLSQKELDKFYSLVEEKNKADSLLVKKDLQNQITSLLSGGFTEKVSERLVKLEKLRKETRVAIKKPTAPVESKKTTTSVKTVRPTPRHYEQQIGL